MSSTRIFVSHSHVDNDFCLKLVEGLTTAGADVWYDEHDLGAGVLKHEIQKQLGHRNIFIVILSKAAFASRWVHLECDWAFDLYQDDRTRIILPVTAGPIEKTDFNPEEGWFFLKGFTRIEAPGYQPMPDDQAIRNVLRVLALTPEGEAPAPVAPQPGESADALLIRGIALRGQKKFDEAGALFERAVQLDPSLANAWFNVGFSRDAVGHYADALTAWEKTTTLDAKNAAAWTNKGSTLLKLHRYPDALDAFETAIGIKDTYVFAWYGKGVALKEMDRAEEALVAYDKALEIDRRFAYACNGKGSALWSLKRLDEAEDAFEKAVEISHSMALAWRNLAGVRLDMQHFQDALDAANTAIEVAPESSVAYQRKADALRGLGHYHDADVAERHARFLHGTGH